MNLQKYKVQDPITWCENNITLDYGKFRRENHPLLLKPLGAISGMRGGIVGLIGSVQHIKTLTAQLWHLYALHTDPKRAAIYDLTDGALREFSDDKFTPLIDNTPAILDTIPKQAYRRTKYYTSTPYGFIRLLSVNILANRNSKTLERVSADESWDYEQNWIDQIRDRMSASPWSWQMFLPTSGQTAGSELDDLWERSTQMVWHVPCDCCGEMIPYIWQMPKEGDEVPVGGMRWAAKEDYIKDGVINFTKLRESVYYECQKCGGRMEADLGRMDARNREGDYIQTNPDGDPKIDFYHYNALAHFPWQDLVEQWKNALIFRDRGKLSGLENFVRKRLAQKWNEGDYITKDIQFDGEGEYNLLEPWEHPGEGFKFCTVDVQKDHFYFVIREWAILNGVLYTRLIDRRKVVSTGEIKDACDMWKIPQGGLNSDVGCRVFLDGNYNTVQVQRIASKNGWMVFRGRNAKDFRHEDGIRRIYSDMQFIDVGEGTVETGQKFVGQFWFSEGEARNRLSLIRSIKDHNGDPVWTYPKDAGEVYIRQINAWSKISKEKPDGSIVFDWINRDPNFDHFYDCEKSQLVCAAMAGLVGSSSVEDEKSEEFEK